jgi:hypothetical protein
MSSQADAESLAAMEAFLKRQIIAVFEDRPAPGESLESFRYWARTFVRAVVSLSSSSR